MPTPKNFHIGIKALIVKSGKVLALKDASRYRGFDLPGGKIDEGETFHQALKRELFEELGVNTFKIGPLVHVYERTDYEKQNASLMLICFKVEATISEITLSHEHTGFEWISKKDLVKMDDKLFRNGEIKKALVKVLE